MDVRASTANGTVAWAFKSVKEAERGVQRLKAAGFGDVRLSESDGTTSEAHVDETIGRTASDFAASLETAGFTADDALQLTQAVAAGGVLLTLAAGAHAQDALAVLRGETVARRAVAPVDIAPRAGSLGEVASAAVAPVELSPAAVTPTPTRALPSNPAGRLGEAGSSDAASATVASPGATSFEDRSGSTTVPADVANVRNMQLLEERLAVTKSSETREARVRKEVVTEHRTIVVPVQHEELVIERDGAEPVRVPIDDV